MPSDFSSYKVASGETSSDTKFDGFVQAVQDAINAIGALAVDPSQINGYPSDGTRYLTGNGSWQKLVHGTVNADGTLGSGSGFTPSKLGTGYYKVTFSAAFGSAPHVLATAETTDTGSVNRYVSAGEKTTTTFVVHTTNTSAAAADAAFSFAAIGSP